MITKFVNDDEAYLSWVDGHPEGFVVNIDEPHIWKPYPMVHRASHRVITTSRRGNYTTKQYYKVCAADLRELEGWAREAFDKKLTRCRVCM
jgi:hypothetical protein